MDWLLVAIAFIIAVFVMGVNFYVLYYYMDEQDKNMAWLPKIVVVAGLSLACYGVLMMPLDVANRNFALAKGLEMNSLPVTEMWQVLLIGIIVMLIGVIPFTLFYYEESGDGVCNQIKKGLCYGGLTLIISTTIIVILYAVSGHNALIPIEDYTSKMYQWDTRMAQGIVPTASYMPTLSETKVKVTFPIFAVGMISVVGYGFFAMFAGVGLVFLPCVLVRVYTQRPTPLPLHEWAAQRGSLRERAEALEKIGGTMKDDPKAFNKEKLNRSDKKLFQKFQNAVYLLEKDFLLLKLRKPQGSQAVNWIYYFFVGFLGLIAGVVSIAWITHVVLFVFIPGEKYPFLNDLLVWLDKQWSFLGTIGYGTFAFYLLWCCVIGVLKCGLRFACFTIHPMEPGKTMLNSFLFNVGIILLCEIPCIQFCTKAFSLYARVTAVSVIFGTQIQYLQYASFLFVNNIFLYVMAVMVLFTLIYVIIKGPADNAAAMTEDVEAKMEYKMNRIGK